jgi:amino acid permease
LVLLLTPSLVELLLGAVPGTLAGMTVSRLAGVALLALAVACWLAREDAAGRAAKGLVAAMLFYNIAVVAILVLAWTNSGLFGIAFWPGSWLTRGWPPGASRTCRCERSKRKSSTAISPSNLIHLPAY